MTAMLPSRRNSPRCRVCSSSPSSSGTACAIATRSLSDRHARDAEGFGDLLSVDAPRHVGQLSDVADHGARDAEAGRIDRVSCARGLLEVLDHRDEVRVAGRGIRARRDLHRPASGVLEQSEQCLGAADVASEKHGERLQITQLRQLTSGLFCLILSFDSPLRQRRPFARIVARPAGPQLAGQLVVFTGKLSSLGRRDARALVVRLGGDTADDVTRKTTMLVVGAEGFGRVWRSREEPAS